jgi:hypothetical protein
MNAGEGQQQFNQLTNRSTIALLVVGGDKKGTQCLEV